jgi:tellurite methyltransferase
MKMNNNLGFGMAIGIAIGSAIGVALDNIGTWLAIGIALGAGIGNRLNKMNDKVESVTKDLPPMGPQDFSEIEDWPGYFKSVLGKPARDTTLTALDNFEKEGFHQGFAIDLAAGEGRDSLELLRRNWRVLATDNQPEAFPLLWARVPEESKAQLTTKVVSFNDMEFPDNDMVNASFALPFCEPEHFDALWNKIVTSIRSGGRFAGQFFGDRDTWASLPNRSHHSHEDIEQLLDGFTIEMIREEERDDAPTLRNPKHWQIFHVVAKKN